MATPANMDQDALGPTASDRQGDGMLPIAPAFHRQSDVEMLPAIVSAQEKISDDVTGTNAAQEPARQQTGDVQMEESHDQMQLNAIQTQHIPTDTPTHYQSGLISSSFAPPPEMLNPKSVVPTSDHSFIVPGEIGAAGHGKPIKSVRGRTHRAGLLARGGRTAPSAMTPPADRALTDTDMAAMTEQLTHPSSDPPAPSLPQQELQLSSSASTSPVPVKKTAVKRASSASKSKTARRSSSNAHSAAETSNSSTSRRIMPARLRHIGGLLEGSSLEAELAGVLGMKDASGSGDHAFKLPPETPFFITTDSDKYMAHAREDKEVASNYKSYFDNEEVQRACRERAEIETPEYEVWDEMEFKGRKRFFEPTTDLSANAYRALQRPAVIREKRQRKLERDRLIKERNKIADRIEMLKTVASKLFFQIVRIRGTLSAVASEDEDAMEAAAEQLRQMLIDEASATLEKYDGAIAHAAIGLEAVLGERDDGADTGVVHASSGSKPKAGGAGTGSGRHGRVTADRSQEAESSRAIRRPRYVESSTEQSDAEPSHIPLGTSAPTAKRPRKSEPVRTVRLSLSRRSVSIGTTPQPESDADKRTESVRRNNPRAASIKTAARITAQYAKGKGRAFDDDYEDDEDDIADEAADEETRPKARATVKASARRDGIQRERDFVLAHPLDVPFRTFNNIQADPPTSPASQHELLMTEPVPPPAVLSILTNMTRNPMSIESIIHHQPQPQPQPQPPPPPPAEAHSSDPVSVPDRVQELVAASPGNGRAPRLNPMSIASLTTSEVHPSISVEASISRGVESPHVPGTTLEPTHAATAENSIVIAPSDDGPDPLSEVNPTSAMINAIEPTDTDMAEIQPALAATSTELLPTEPSTSNAPPEPVPTSSSSVSTNGDSHRPQLRPGSLICVDVPPRPAFHTLLLWGCFRFTSASLGKDATPEEIRRNLGQWTEEEWDEREFGDQNAAERTPEEIRNMLIYGWTTKTRRRPSPAQTPDAIRGDEIGAEGLKNDDATKVDTKERATVSVPVKWETVEETHLHKVGPSLLELSETHIEYAAQMEKWEAEVQQVPVDQEKPPQPEWDLVLREVCSRRPRGGRAGRGVRGKVKAEEADKSKAPEAEGSQKRSARGTLVTQNAADQNATAPKTPTRATRSSSKPGGDLSNGTSPRPSRLLRSNAISAEQDESSAAAPVPGPQSIAPPAPAAPTTLTVAAADTPPVAAAAAAAAPALNMFSNWIQPPTSLAQPDENSSSTLYLSDDSAADPLSATADGLPSEYLAPETGDVAQLSQTIAPPNGDTEPTNGEHMSSQGAQGAGTDSGGADLISSTMAEENPSRGTANGPDGEAKADQAEVATQAPSSTAAVKDEGAAQTQSPSKRASPSKRQSKIKLAVGTRSSSSRLKTLSAFGEKPPLALLEKDSPFDRLAEYKLHKWGYLTYVDAGDPSVSATSARGAYAYGTPVGSDSGSGRWRALMEVARERERVWFETVRKYDEEKKAKSEAAAAKVLSAISSSAPVEPSNSVPALVEASSIAASVDEGHAADTQAPIQGTNEAQS
ncbi:hypothetical protein OC861_005111 [Tilletia horrida]|nr:hypothetical protein OC861_005111 [Tilletia horrida]